MQIHKMQANKECIILQHVCCKHNTSKYTNVLQVAERAAVVIPGET